MECPKCQFDNPDSVKFCGTCGSRIEKVCSNCGAANPPQFKFCGECGHALDGSIQYGNKEPSFDEKLSAIQKYLPGGITEKILAQKGKIEGERRQVTVLFADMENFTALVEKLGPEETYTVMDQVYEILIHKVHEFEGTVNEMTGDGIMALFGAPIALEDAPQRAIRAALAIHQEIARFSDKVKQEKDIGPIRMRIGINTGPVVVGTLGNNLRVEFKAVGDTVNIASRIQNLAGAGTTYVSLQTFNLTEGLFRFESLGNKAVKGITQPLRVYQVIATSSSRTRFEVSAERGLTPLIGRARELELLLDGLDRACQGQGQAFSIVGDAGIGKSRLLYEFRKAIATENITLLEGKCLSYGRGSAYHPISDILKGAFDITEGDGDAQIKKKVQYGLRILSVPASPTLPYILELLNVSDSGIKNISLSPEGKKDRIIETLKQIMIKSSEIRPLVIAVEDLHWADRSTEDVLKYLLEGIPGANAVLIFTYRPGFVHTWGAKSFHNQITLNRLSNRESLAMASNLLETTQMEREIEELILSRTEGVPFFLEEFVKSIKDLNIIRKEKNKYLLNRSLQEVKIPFTIQDMIMARVDGLPNNAKDLLQTASVIEREFSYDLIQRVTGLSQQELFSGFSLLKDAELLYERGIFPELNYVFKHALTRDVVYESILTKKRKTIHEQIAGAIEVSSAGNIDHKFGLVAAHFIAAENFIKGAEYSRLAGKKAIKAGLLVEAVEHNRGTLNCIERHQGEELKDQLIAVRTNLGLSLAQINYYMEAKKVIDPIIDAVAEADRRSLGRVYTILGSYHLIVTEDLAAAGDALEKAIKISEEQNDILAWVLSNYWMGCVQSYECHFDKAIDHFQKTINTNMAANNLWGIATSMASMAYFCYYQSGQISTGFQITTESIQKADESGDSYSKMMAYVIHGVMLFAKGFFEDAENFLEKGVRFCERSNEKLWFSVGHFFLAELFFCKGLLSAAEKNYHTATEALELTEQNPSFRRVGEAGIIMTKVLNKDKDVDIRALYALMEYSIRLKISVGWFSNYIAQTLMCIDGQLYQAEAWIRKAIDADQINGMRFNLGRDYALYANWFLRTGNRLKAQESLGMAMMAMKECGAEGWIEKYKNELDLIA